MSTAGLDLFRQREATPEPPEWFEAPDGLDDGRGVRVSLFDLGARNLRLSNFVAACRRGEFALAPWQRPAVWTEDQRVKLLDSIMRCMTIGALTMWAQQPGREVEARPLPGCALPIERATLIVDGQQRTLALLAAAAGDLDHWRWNGSEWTTGRGFLTPSLAINSFHHPLYCTWGGLVPRAAFRHLARLESSELDFIVINGSPEEVVEAYRRLAMHGSPHSPADLAVMEAWLEPRGSTGSPRRCSEL